jgi:VWFA-related protein
MKRLVAIGGLVMAAVASPAAERQERPVFRADVDAVLVDVSVMDGHKPVANLTPGDFVVLDNGVEQTVTSLDFARVPVDVRLVFDTSGSLANEQLDQHTQAMRQLGAALKADDRLEILQFRRKAVRMTPLQSPPVRVVIDREGAEGTAFFDAASLAMITSPRPGRRQLTILMSDGVDTASFFDWATLEHAAERSDAVVYTVTATALTASRVNEGPSQGLRPRARLERVASATGGRFVEPGADNLGALFVKVLNEFRQSYVLRYTLTGVARAGWHTLTVTVRGPKKYDVRARRGYGS